MRIALHEQTILVGAGLALIAIDDEVVGVFAGRQESPFDAGRKSRTAASEQCGIAHFAVHLGWAALQSSTQAVVSAGGF